MNAEDKKVLKAEKLRQVMIDVLRKELKGSSSSTTENFINTKE